MGRWRGAGSDVGGQAMSEEYEDTGVSRLREIIITLLGNSESMSKELLVKEAFAILDELEQ